MGVSAHGLTARSTHRLRCCSHNREAILLIARTAKNNGRPFYRCPYWQDSTSDCGYFKWTDEKTKIDEALSTSNDRTSDLDPFLDELRCIRVVVHRLRLEIRCYLVIVSFLVIGLAYGIRIGC
ncbi:hypothetical protein LINPERHAP1_LOCUS34889 [Linum perenne]